MRTLLLLVAQAASLGAWVAFTGWEVRQNARLIRADGVRDSLRATFHRQRTLLRLGVALVLAGVGALPLRGTGLAPGLGGLALLVGMGAYFAWAFTPQLNLARGLPRYYVGFAPQAAHFPDRLLADRAARRYPAQPAAQQAWAATALRYLLRACWPAALRPIAACWRGPGAPCRLLAATGPAGRPTGVPGPRNGLVTRVAGGRPAARTTFPIHVPTRIGQLAEPSAGGPGGSCPVYRPFSILKKKLDSPCFVFFYSF